MSTIIELFSMPKNKNSTAVAGGTSLGSTTVLLKDDTSIIHPVFQLDMAYNGIPDGANIARANWLYWGHCQRYYWITDMTFITRDIVEISCTVDVLATYINGILNSDAYVNYANKSYNALVPDKRLPFTIAKKHGGFKYKVTGLSASGSIVVFGSGAGVTGNTGLTQGYLCSTSALTAMSQLFFGDDFLSKVRDTLYSPLDAMYSCMWLSCDPSLISTASKELKLGEFSMGTYPTIKNTAASETTLTPTLPYQDPVTGYYDWRNVSPYTEWFIWLPGVGYQPFPMDLCLDGKSQNVQIKVLMQLSPANGEITYTLKCKDVIVMVSKGNIGVPFPVGKSTNGIAGAVSSAAGAMSGLAFGAATLNPITLGAGAVSAVASGIGAGIGLLQHSVGASGSMGGLATPTGQRDYIELTYVASELPDNPYGELKDLIGCPVFKHSQLNSYVGGKVFCSNINYKWSGDLFPTDEEYDMIRSFMTSQDGVLLERSV